MKLHRSRHYVEEGAEQVGKRHPNGFNVSARTHKANKNERGENYIYGKQRIPSQQNLFNRSGQCGNGSPMILDHGLHKGKVECEQPNKNNGDTAEKRSDKRPVLATRIAQSDKLPRAPDTEGHEHGAQREYGVRLHKEACDDTDDEHDAMGNAILCSPAISQHANQTRTQYPNRQKRKGRWEKAAKTP